MIELAIVAILLVLLFYIYRKKQATPVKKDYTIEDYVVYSASDTDCGFLKGTLKECTNFCDGKPECLGFSRAKNANDGDVGECYFKKILDAPRRTVRDGTWYTYRKP